MISASNQVTTNVLKNGAGQVFMGLQFYLIQVNKISFVEIGKKCGILYLVCKKC